MTIRILVSLATLMLGGCAALGPDGAPATRSEYLYAAPPSPEGQRCVSVCDRRKAQCQAVAENDSANGHQRCEQQAQDEYENCAMRTTSFSEKRQCYRKTCPVTVSDANCDSAYRHCFESCGGTVWSRQVCEGPC